MPTAVHALRRLPAAACPQMSRMNVGHRPAVHSPHRHPRGRRGLGGRVVPEGNAALRSPVSPAREAGLSGNLCRRVLCSAEAMRRRPGAVLEWVCPP